MGHHSIEVLLTRKLAFFAGLALAGCCLLATAAEVPGEALWTRQGGGGSIGVDENGNVYTSGSGFLTKFDTSGEAIWNKPQIPATIVGALAIDGTNGVCVTGGFREAVDFGGTNLNSVGCTDIFVAKYDPQGRLVWARQASGYEDSKGNGICVDFQGHVYVTGELSGSGNFGTANLPSNEQRSQSSFLVKYDETGRLLWATSIDSALSAGVAADAEGNCYVAGWFYGTIAIGDVAVTNIGNGSMLLAKFDPGGHLLWVRQAAGGRAEYCGAYAVALAESGRLVVTGSYYGTISFGRTNLQGAGAFFASYDLDGDLQWLRKSGELATDPGISVAVDRMGSAYVSGWFYDTALFGWTNLTAVGVPDLFVAKLDAAGEVLWVLQATNCASGGITADPGGNIYFTGGAYSTTRLGGSLIPSGPFLAKFGTTSVMLRLTRIAGGVVLSWSALADRFVVEETGSIAEVSPWAPVDSVPNLAGKEKQVMLSVAGQRRFFRLRRP